MIDSRDQGAPERRLVSASPDAARYIAECGRALGAVLPGLLAGLFDKVDDALYDLADKAANNRQYTVYFDAMRIIRKQSRVLQNAFLRLLRQGAENALAGLLECDLRLPSELDPESMGLVPEVELEESLALENLISKAESRYRRDLMEMSFFLGRLLDRPDLDARSNPYGPAAICEAFRSAVATARHLQPPIRLVVYKLFDKQVMDRLGDYYARCVERAVAMGHRRGAGLAHRFRGALREQRGIPAGHSASAPPRADAARPIEPSPQSASPSPSLSFESIQALLDRLRAPAGAGGSGPASVRAQGHTPLDTDELMGLLTNLGARTLSDAPASALTPLTAVIGRSPAGASRSLAKDDEDTLDLVFLFFEHLLQGNGVPDGLKALIGRLQIPIAKLALIDKGFFTDIDHPARRLLNHIGEAAVGWSEDDERTPDSLYGMIERVVERLILDFDGDPILFVRMDRFFVTYLAHEASKVREAEAACVAELGERGTDADREAVAAALDALLAPYPQVPAVIDTILRQGLLPAMLVYRRTRGAESAEWLSGLDLAERLLWSVQPKIDPEERRQLLRRIPEILRALRAHLAESGCDRRQLARWFRDLQTVHLGVLQGEIGDTDALPVQSDAAPAISQGSVPSAGVPDAAATGSGAGGISGGAAGAVAGTSVGTWIELTREDGRRHRLRVVWVGADGSLYRLVDRHGQRAPDLTGRELGMLIDQGRAHLLGDGSEPIADRALRLVVHRLSR